MDTATKQLVRDRAGNRCEYCRVHQRDFLITFHVEHVVAQQHGGSDGDSNLAPACHRCNRFKGPNLTGLDPDSGEITRLFNPRSDKWDQHFEVADGMISGKTAIGRTSAALLMMNTPERVQVRLAIGWDV